jgi:dTDP-4-dehydrorhamnose reductase
MKVFIIGASGLVGSNCQKHFSEMGAEVKGSYFSYPVNDAVFFNTLDLQHTENFDIVSWKPDVILHCGALTHVDYCEQNEQESYEKTVVSTLNVIQVAKACGAKMVYISTDYVFDGVEGPYTELAKVNPLSIYAKHKYEAEQSVLTEIGNALVLRVTNVYGEEVRGKNFIARIIQQCLDQQKLTLTLPYDQFASPTNAWDIARAMYLLLKDNKKGIYHIGSTDYMNRVALALQVLKHFPDAEYDLIPKSTLELNQPAKRPLLGGFVTLKFSSEYPSFQFHNVDDYVRSVVKNKIS